MTAIETLVQEISELKPMPKIANQIIAMAQDPDASMAAVADLILYEPSLTANILKMCNSAYFGLPRKIESVQDAISLLGLSKVVDMVLLSSSSENYRREQVGYGLDRGELWRQSVSSALIARQLAEKRENVNKHLVFTAALLKDIGKVVLDRFVADSFEKIQRLVNEKGFSFREAEKKVIGLDHSELGALVAKKWQFSDKMIYIIKNHHLADPAARSDLETCIVYVADTICMMIGVGMGHDGLAYRFYKEVLDALCISERELQEIIAGFGADMQKVQDLFQVTQTPG